VCDVLGLRFKESFEPSRPLEGLSNKTIKHHHRLISAILNQAVYWQVIPSNPAQKVKPPKMARTEAKFLDEKETAKLLALLEGETIQHSTMIKMFIYSGLRRGEMCGLEWGDIDFGNHLITVRRSSQYVPGKGIYTKETKTDLPQITIHSLRHTNITLLLAAGVSLRTVSYRAGHAQTSTTQNIYAHAIRTTDEMASEALDDILTPKSNIKKLS